MAIAFTNLTHSTTTGPSATIVSSSVTPSSNNLVLVMVYGTLASGNGAGALGSLVGNGLTYVNILSTAFGAVQGTGHIGQLEVWRGLGSSPTAGAVTATFSTSPTSLGISISQASGVNTTGTNGSGAIGITNSDANGGGTATPATLAMTPFGSVNNGSYCAVGTTASTNTVTAGTSMALLGTNSTVLVGTDEWAAGNVNPVQVNFATAPSWGIIGLEIIAAAAGGGGGHFLSCIGAGS